MNNTKIRRPNVRASKSTSGADSGGKAKWIIAVIVLLILAAISWAFIPRSDPAMARIQDLRGQIDTAPPEKRRELFGQMRQEFESLSPESREQLRDQWRARMEAREQKRLNEFFALSPAEQITKIDQDIREDEKEDQERAKRRAQRQASGQGNRGPGNAGGNRGWGGGGNRGNRDSLERRKGYLDNTNPTTRAQRSEYRRMRDERRQAMGYPPRNR